MRRTSVALQRRRFLCLQFCYTEQESPLKRSSISSEGGETPLKPILSFCPPPHPLLSTPLRPTNAARPVKSLFIVSLCPFTLFSPPRTPPGSMVEGVKTFLSRFTSDCQRNPFHLHQLSQQASAPTLLWSPLSVMGILFPFVGKRVLDFFFFFQASKPPLHLRD